MNEDMNENIDMYISDTSIYIDTKNGKQYKYEYKDDDLNDLSNIKDFETLIIFIKKIFNPQINLQKSFENEKKEIIFTNREIEFLGDKINIPDFNEYTKEYNEICEGTINLYDLFYKFENIENIENIEISEFKKIPKKNFLEDFLEKIGEDKKDFFCKNIESSCEFSYLENFLQTYLFIPNIYYKLSNSSDFSDLPNIVNKFEELLEKTYNLQTEFNKRLILYIRSPETEVFFDGDPRLKPIKVRFENDNNFKTELGLKNSTFNSKNLNDFKKEEPELMKPEKIGSFMPNFKENSKTLGLSRSNSLTSSNPLTASPVLNSSTLRLSRSNSLTPSTSSTLEPSASTSSTPGLSRSTSSTLGSEPTSSTL